MPEKNLISIDAKTYDTIANRISLPQDQKTIDRQINDAVYNVQRELKKEGHTGKLTSPDGLVHFKPVPYKGFVISLYGQVTYRSQLDIYGRLMIIGTATGKTLIKGKEADMILSIEDSFPNGIEDIEDAMKYFIGLIDSFRGGK